MGTLTYLQMTTEVKAALGNRTNFDSDRLLHIMNLAQMRIARANRWEELDSTTDTSFSVTASAENDKILALPDNTRDVYSVRVITGTGESRKLKRRTARWFDQNIPEPEYYARGKPSFYARFGERFEVWRVPDDTYRVLIRRCAWPTPFTGSDGQVSDLDEKDDMLVALGINWAFQSLGRGEDAAKWWRIYSNMLKDAIGEENERPDMDIKPTSEDMLGIGEYWNDPFIRSIK